MNQYRIVKNILDQSIDIHEASAIAFMLFEKMADMDKMHVLMGDAIPLEKEEAIIASAKRIANGEPVQYVIGETDFLDISLKVGDGVLIPRPETEELVEWGIETLEGTVNCNDRILDIGTGSGCIAISLAKLLNAQIEAWDISDKALGIAKGNAERNSANVNFRNVDILRYSVEKNYTDKYKTIFSNPPYICDSEASDMDSNVLDHEPHLALFVPDSDPLLFYRKIAEVGKDMLQRGGYLFYEINRRFGNDTVNMLQELGYTDIQLRKDQFGNDRMIRAKLSDKK